MENASRDAATLQLGLQIGTRTVSDVVRWAERMIASEDEPSSVIIDLAMMDRASRLDVFGKLGELVGEYEIFELLPTVLRDAHALLEQDPTYGPQLARCLYAIFVDCRYEVPDEFDEIVGFEDEYALATQGIYGSEQDVYARLLQFTGRFRDAA